MIASDDRAKRHRKDVILLQDECNRILGEFLDKTAELSLSTVLVGSQSKGNAHGDSDIDIIILTRGNDEAVAVRRVADEFDELGPRPVLDCKVYTEQEFSAAKAGKENRFLWTCLVNGRVLSGHDITKEIELIPQTVCDSVWEHVLSVENACDKLAAGVQFTGCCYHLYDALATLYFVDRFILESIGSSATKEAFIKSHLGQQYVEARERYYWVVRHAGHVTSLDSLRVPATVDRRFKEKDYVGMLQKGKKALEFLNEEFKDVTRWANLQT